MTGGHFDVGASIFVNNWAGDNGGAIDVDYATGTWLDTDPLDLGGPAGALVAV